MSVAFLYHQPLKSCANLNKKVHFFCFQAAYGRYDQKVTTIPLLAPFGLISRALQGFPETIPAGAKIRTCNFPTCLKSCLSDLPSLGWCHHFLFQPKLASNLWPVLWGTLQQSPASRFGQGQTFTRACTSCLVASRLLHLQPRACETIFGLILSSNFQASASLSTNPFTAPQQRSISE